MRKLILALSLVATALPVAAVDAQRYGRGYNNREVRQERRECRRELAQARRSGRWQHWDRRWRRW
jgi:hypothetical protein